MVMMAIVFGKIDSKATIKLLPRLAPEPAVTA